MHTFVLWSTTTFYVVLFTCPLKKKKKKSVPVDAGKECIYTSHETPVVIHQEALEIPLVMQGIHCKVWVFVFDALELTI